MRALSFKRHRFSAEVIRYTVWLYFRFTLSFRDVEELLAQRGIEVSYETIRCWTIKFGPQIARNLKRRRPAPSPRWHLDEMVCSVGGRRMYLWRAVDDEGEVLDLVMQRRRDTGAALKLLKRLLRNQPVEPISITTDGLGSYTAALKELELSDLHHSGRLRENNRAENSHLPIRRPACDAPPLRPRVFSIPRPQFVVPGSKQHAPRTPPGSQRSSSSASGSFHRRECAEAANNCFRNRGHGLHVASANWRGGPSPGAVRQPPSMGAPRTRREPQARRPASDQARPPPRRQVARTTA